MTWKDRPIFDLWSLPGYARQRIRATFLDLFKYHRPNLLATSLLSRVILVTDEDGHPWPLVTNLERSLPFNSLDPCKEGIEIFAIALLGVRAIAVTWADIP